MWSPRVAGTIIVKDCSIEKACPSPKVSSSVIAVEDIVELSGRH